jgi:hypothetical protein
MTLNFKLSHYPRIRALGLFTYLYFCQRFSALRFPHYNHLVPLCEGDYGSYVWFLHDSLP